MRYHVILTYEEGDEFSVEIEASDGADAWDTVQMDYPESEVVAVLKSWTFNDLWKN